ncbi:MAG TPA: YciI family protein [Acidimicrobiales bacterium]|nr:YciI family protein [Acidimicrobiales bacterium]
MLIHVVPVDLGSEEGQSWRPDASLTAWLDETIPAGVNLQGSRLRPSSDATTVRSRQGELIVTDGPFAETKEQLAGYDVLQCADHDEAVRWASKHPTAGIGAIEVRPLLGSSPPMPLPEPREGTMRYMLLVCLGEDFQMGPQDGAEIGPATDAWVKEMDGRGARLFGSQLEGPERARTVRRKGSELVVTDGPFAETKEQIAGFDVLECSDLDEALEVAAKHPMAKFGMLELRPFWPPEEP